MFDNLYQRSAQGANTYYAVEAFADDEVVTGVQCDTWKKFKPWLENIIKDSRITKMFVLSVGMNTISGTYIRDGADWAFEEDENG